MQTKFFKKNIHNVVITFFITTLCIFTISSYAKNPAVLTTAIGYDQVGNASWYGAELHGSPTSTGKDFNKNAMTAASRVLPIGSYVLVTNISNNKIVTVQITDKGPFSSDRIIDVSHAAAKELGFVGKGVTRVRVIGIENKDAQKK